MTTLATPLILTHKNASKIRIGVSSVTEPYTLTLPKQGNLGYLYNDGNGNTIWKDMMQNESKEVRDFDFCIYNDTIYGARKLAFSLYNISPQITRILSMPNADVDLGDIATNTAHIKAFNPELLNLTEHEIKQLQNINMANISQSNWSILGSINQPLSTNSYVRFLGIESQKISAGQICRRSNPIILPDMDMKLTIQDIMESGYFISDVLTQDRVLFLPDMQYARGTVVEIIIDNTCEWSWTLCDCIAPPGISIFKIIFGSKIRVVRI